jgi:hypothetical protein
LTLQSKTKTIERSGAYLHLILAELETDLRYIITQNGMICTNALEVLMYYLYGELLKVRVTKKLVNNLDWQEDLKICMIDENKNQLRPYCFSLAKKFPVPMKP